MFAGLPGRGYVPPLSTEPVEPSPFAPALDGALADFVLEEDTGVHSISAQAVFIGAAMIFSLPVAPAGVTVDAGSGLVMIGTAALLTAQPVTVRASNGFGAAQDTFLLTVTASPVDLGALPATLGVGDWDLEFMLIGVTPGPFSGIEVMIIGSTFQIA